MENKVELLVEYGDYVGYVKLQAAEQCNIDYLHRALRVDDSIEVKIISNSFDLDVDDTEELLTDIAEIFTLFNEANNRFSLEDTIDMWCSYGLDDIDFDNIIFWGEDEDDAVRCYATISANITDRQFEGLSSEGFINYDKVLEVIRKGNIVNCKSGAIYEMP